MRVGELKEDSYAEEYYVATENDEDERLEGHENADRNALKKRISIFFYASLIIMWGGFILYISSFYGHPELLSPGFVLYEFGLFFISLSILYIARDTQETFKRVILYIIATLIIIAGVTFIVPVLSSFVPTIL